MSKAWVDLTFFVTMALLLVYSIITKFNEGICVSVMWSTFYLFKFIYDLVELRTRLKRLDREAKENFNNTVITSEYQIDWYKEAGLNAKRIMELEAERTKAKQEVASTVIKFLINKKHELQKENDLINASVEFYDFIDNFIGLTGKEILAEIEKKYVGEVTKNV